MAVSINELWIVLSGGAANDSSAASLGGGISTDAQKRVRSQVTTSPANITGVVINDAYGNTEGIGNLYYSSSTGQLGWRPSGVVDYAYTAVPSNGTYILGTSAGYLVVTVTTASLPGTDKIDSISVIGATEAVFNDVPESTALLGATYYRCFYLLNTNGSDTAQDVRIWLPLNTQAGDEISIALDPVGVNGTAIGPLADQEDNTSLLSGITWSQPATYGTGLDMGNLAAGHYYPFWIRQHIPVETRGTVLSNKFRIAVAALV